MTLHIHTLIDPATGEIVPFSPELAHQVRELQTARLARQLRQVGKQRPRTLRPAPVDEEAELWRLFAGG